jgi:hypothetical protein
MIIILKITNLTGSEQSCQFAALRSRDSPNFLIPFLEQKQVFSVLFQQPPKQSIHYEDGGRLFLQYMGTFKQYLECRPKRRPSSENLIVPDVEQIVKIILENT